MHHWSDDDNMIAYCLYRFGDDVFGRDRHELGDLLGMGFNSLNLKLANFKAIDGRGGLEQYSQQALRIFSLYTDLPDEEVRQAGYAAMERAGNDSIPRLDDSRTPRTKDMTLEMAKQRLAKIEREHAEALTLLANIRHREGTR